MRNDGTSQAAGSMEGRIALVTGAASGLGRAIAARLMQDGAKVIISDVDLKAAESAAQALGGGDAVRLNVADPAMVEATMSEVARRHGRLDMLVNNAGVLGRIASIVDLEEAEARRILEVNFMGTVFCLKYALPIMLAQKSGSIVNIASTGGKEGPPYASIYGASKAAVISLTKSAAKEVVQSGVRINCVSPTLLSDTGMVTEMPPTFRADTIARIPMGRPARAEEVAAVVRFLLCDEASFVTAQCYDVSGGRSIW